MRARLPLRETKAGPHCHGFQAVADMETSGQGMPADRRYEGGEGPVDLSPTYSYTSLRPFVRRVRFDRSPRLAVPLLFADWLLPLAFGVALHGSPTLQTQAASPRGAKTVT
jgi:hypothetical protein